jgi:hypothetical protein
MLPAQIEKGRIMKSIWRFFLIAAVAMGAVVAPMAAGAQDAGELRLQLLAQQEQRAYRIAKAACLVMSGSQSDFQATSATQTAQAFDAGMQVLTQGDPAVTMAPESDLMRRQELEDISRLSKGMTRSSLQIAAGDFHTVPVSLLLIRNQIVADRIHLAMAHVYAPPEQPIEWRNAIQQLQGQHALIEELLRDLCYARLSLGPADMAEQMRARMIRFEQVNAALIAGDAKLAVAKAPNISIKIALGQVDSKWISLRALLDAAANGAEQDVRDVQLASVLGETLTRRLDKLIGMYHKL